MNKRIKLRKNNYLFKPSNIVVMIVILVILITSFILIKFNKVITPKLWEIADMKIYNMISIIISKSFNRSTSFNDLLILDINNGEINEVNFDMDRIYKIAEDMTNKFNENMVYIENGQWDKVGYIDNDALKNDYGYVLSFPVGVASKSIFFANLGPKIPVKIKLVGTTLNTIETKISDYGINNALVEVYIDMNIEREIITPLVMGRDKITYKYLVYSKIIQGKVPLFYSGILTKGTNLSIPIS